MQTHLPSVFVMFASQRGEQDHPGGLHSAGTLTEIRISVVYHAQAGALKAWVVYAYWSTTWRWCHVIGWPSLAKPEILLDEAYAMHSICLQTFRVQKECLFQAWTML